MFFCFKWACFGATPVATRKHASHCSKIIGAHCISSPTELLCVRRLPAHNIVGFRLQWKQSGSGRRHGYRVSGSPALTCEKPLPFALGMHLDCSSQAAQWSQHDSGVGIPVGRSTYLICPRGGVWQSAALTLKEEKKTLIYGNEETLPSTYSIHAYLSCELRSSNMFSGLFKQHFFPSNCSWAWICNLL